LKIFVLDLKLFDFLNFVGILEFWDFDILLPENFILIKK